jgi:NAD(P)-dependent dehydrogenase (short-subunit alcohol dehydrogenase family)
MTRQGFDDPKIRQQREEGLLLKHLTSNRDPGLLALYLASPASDWMTGQVIALDGGETALYNEGHPLQRISGRDLNVEMAV